MGTAQPERLTGILYVLQELNLDYFILVVAKVGQSFKSWHSRIRYLGDWPDDDTVMLEKRSF